MKLSEHIKGFLESEQRAARPCLPFLNVSHPQINWKKFILVCLNSEKYMMLGMSSLSPGITVVNYTI